MTTIRVMVVDDHTLMRQGLVGLLDAEQDIEVVGESGEPSAVLGLIAEVGPDVVLLDIGLPGTSGLDVTPLIKERYPQVRVLIVTMHDREDYLFQALRVGASGYVLKGADVKDLLGAVRTVHAGNVYVYPSLTGKLVQDYLKQIDSGADRGGFDGLSDREREVVRLIAEGLTSAEIAAAMHLSPHTVQSHRDHIMTKLDLHSKVALTRYAIRKGLVDLES